MNRRSGRPKLGYHPAVITYVDILGFKELIHSESPGRISKILRLLREVVEPDEGSKELHRIVFRNFSDLVLRYAPLDTESNLDQPSGLLSSEIFSLVQAQNQLIEEGIILRGGMTVGLIRSSRGVIYGPGLVRAYELERESDYPRILLDPNMFDSLRENPLLRLHDFEREKAEISTMVHIGKHGTFIDYLGGISWEFDYPEVGYVTLLRTHRDFIRRNLLKYRENRNVHRKYKWLAAYHNHTVREMIRSGFFEQRELDRGYAESLIA